MNLVNSVNPFRLLQFLLGAVFVYAGAVKLRDPLAFADSIATFKILPAFLVNPLALILPPLEVLTGVMLILTVSSKRLAVSGACEMASGGRTSDTKGREKV